MAEYQIDLLSAFFLKSILLRREKKTNDKTSVSFTHPISKKYLEIPNLHLNCRDEKNGNGVEHAAPLGSPTATTAIAIGNEFESSPGS